MAEIKTPLHVKKDFTYKVIIAIPPLPGQSIMIDEGDSKIIEVGDSCELWDILNGDIIVLRDKVPGIYSATLSIQSFKSNRPLDPEEWDMNVSLSDLKILDVVTKEVVDGRITYPRSLFKNLNRKGE